MRKTMLFALAILLALAAAIPAAAQNRRPHRRDDGYTGSALERVTNRNMGMVDGILNNVGRGRSDNRYDRRGNNRDYRDYNRNRHPWVPGAIRELGKTVRTAIIVRASRDDQDERARARRQQDRDIRPRQQRDEDTSIFRNCTRERVYVGDPRIGDGFYLESGESRQAPDSSPVYGNFGDEFVRARIVWQGNMALITAPEEQ